MTTSVSLAKYESSRSKVEVQKLLPVARDDRWILSRPHDQDYQFATRVLTKFTQHIIKGALDSGLPKRLIFALIDFHVNALQTRSMIQLCEGPEAGERDGSFQTR
jgi:hypothetical protein